MSDSKYTIPRWISLIFRSGQLYIGGRLKGHEVSKGQYSFLNALYRKDGLSQEEISSYLRIDKGTTAKALKKLEAQGYVVRQVRDEDKRSYRVFLTPKALGIKDEIRSVLTDWRGLLTAGFTEEEKAMALSLLERMERNAALYCKEGGAAVTKQPSQEPEDELRQKEEDLSCN